MRNELMQRLMECRRRRAARLAAAWDTLLFFF
jgi:hypothetical protein